jgi:hypothetical protein
MENLIEFSLAVLLSVPFDIKGHILYLHEFLDPNSPNYKGKEQHKNIQAIIKLYEEQKIDGVNMVYIVDTKIVSKKEMFLRKTWG